MSHLNVTFRFYEELNDFLTPERRKTRFSRLFNGSSTIKDAIESLGVPHTEVDVVLVNGRSVDFAYRIHDGDDVAVYPVFEALDVTNVTRLRPQPLRKTTFVCDVHCGRLAKALRLLGFDTVYRNDFEDSEIVAIATSDHRIVLTRDRGILKHSAVTHGYCVRSSDWRTQTREVIERFDLHHSCAPFTRCVECNGTIVTVNKKEVTSQLDEKTNRYFDDFTQCEACKRIYWKGSHYEKLLKEIERLLKL